MITSTAFAGKHFAVLGLARSGRATVDALLASGARVTAWDDNEAARTTASANVAIENFVDGDLSWFDSIVVTPGLPLNRHPIAARAKVAGVEIIGDIELFARARAELPPHRVVGITGTNGKSTTTALIHHILHTAGVPSLMGGNIGLPILAQDPLPEGGVYVLELSSYQLDLTQTLDCDVAVLLNITPDHLDRYDSLEAYAASKARLFEMQSAGHPAVIVGDDEFSRRLAETLGSRLIRTGIGYWVDGGVSICDSVERRVLRPEKVTEKMLMVDADMYGAQSSWPTLQGPHNAQNAVAAMAVAFALIYRHGLDLPDAALGLAFETFPGLPHRLERVRDLGGVLFVNDSKATNAEAAAPALAAYSKVRWIVGGQAKTEALGDTARHLDHVVKAYAIGEAGAVFARLLREASVEVAECGTLERAVKEAASEALSGDTVLLSPACASFDQFTDYEARGEAFRAAVEAL